MDEPFHKEEAGGVRLVEQTPDSGADVTVDPDSDAGQKLRRIAEKTGRLPSDVLQDAIEGYLDVDEQLPSGARSEDQ